jgi:hypothetical protein
MIAGGVWIARPVVGLGVIIRTTEPVKSQLDGSSAKHPNDPGV